MNIPSLDNDKEDLELGIHTKASTNPPTIGEETSASTGVRGPRSRIVEAILLLLYTKPMRSSEIARILNKPAKLISSYLSYWKSRGYVAYKSGYWVLTNQGEEHAKMIIESMSIPIASPQDVVLLAHNMINEPVQTTINNWRSLKTPQHETEIQRFIANLTNSKVGKQLQKGANNATALEKALSCVTRILESKNLLEDEMLVINHLIKHYIEWGSTYLYLDQISEELHYQVHELVSILRKLQSKRLVYLYTDRRFGIRVGLGKSFKQILDQCIAKQS
uniref:Replication initiator protein WhiP n=1 Tax=Ignisphaera aggregans TaxID=334771 RepID=A0A7C2ZCW1_9CREN